MKPDHEHHGEGPELTPFGQLPFHLQDAYNNLALQLNRCGVRFDAEVALDGPELSRLIAPQLVEAFVQGDLCVTHRRTLGHLLSTGSAYALAVDETANLIDDKSSEFDPETDQLRSLSGCLNTLMTQFASLLHCQHTFTRNIIHTDN